MKRFASQHKRSKYRERQPNNSISFSSFTFTDNVTNNKIRLKEASEKYPHSLPSNTPNPQPRPQQQQVHQLHNCLDLIKTTKLFQRQALKNKLFKSHHSHNPTLNLQDDLHQTKKGLSSLIQQSIKQVGRKQMQEWLVDPNKRINPQIMGLRSISGHKLTRSNILKILSNQEKAVQQPPILQTIENIESVLHIKQEHQLREKIQHTLNTLKAQNAYLIRPDTPHELFQKLYGSCKSKKGPRLKKQLVSQVKMERGEEGVFQPVLAGPKVDAMQKRLLSSKVKKAQSQQERQLIYAVENNLFFDMQLLLTGKPELIQTRDRKGHNLLHIAAKNRNQQFFEFLLKRAGQESLKSKNNLGKTPLDLAKLYGVEGIVSCIQNYSVY